ncbi:MAG: hypothetical protein COZ06_17880 [Armatimonadetes bacterium CG_4_10_14_3_um_filter_66_18]|nr:hypothetical protein [Armatimonadota bacterium]PIX37869.1 MAG: hypothetical protein COZ57_32025 [Armatimonadetes bacterium CG_4_8_14_3_um_filter_66_20]PIY47172.1 MAG: hypothetical protein COZ06_17880 [Armatimonadetes bacterium CG_4_10_14_3_um_filter_66_18]PIZ49715.1 MAG: hypothetical protein COY42_03455 [Armatimonadetes bacterium CG_4_10_14_0_8_um_filter_66_14]PJB73920.1 MAG: hypothetical protein CO096_04570 [Armatimonadetes bacterium CG_4_9_14_3_um_filter_66_14]
MDEQASRIANGVTAVALLAWTLVGCGSQQTTNTASQPRPPKVSATPRGEHQEAQLGAGETSRSDNTLLTAAEAAPAPKTPAAKKPASAAPADAATALQRAQNQKKHAFLLFYKQGNDACAKMRMTLVQAEKNLGKKAVFYAADVSSAKDKATVQEYRADQAPLPLTLVFAPNGAIVKAFPGKVATQQELGKAFASPVFADVTKAMQDRKLVLLCVQGGKTQGNSSSLSAARAAAADKRAGGSIEVVRAAPEDSANADLLKQLEVAPSLKKASLFILVPPGVIAGKVDGETTKGAVWAAIVKGVSSCSSGSCGPGGCG